MPSNIPFAAGGGGIFRAETFVFNQTIASGQTGDLLIIGTAGKVARLTKLLGATASLEPGISIDVDGATLVGPGNLADITPSATEFFVAPAVGDVTLGLGGGNIMDVFAEFITIKKNAGNTANAISVSYEIGSIK